MKKSILFAALSMFIATAFFGLEVDEAEIRSTSTTIEFINYTGPHKVIDSIGQYVDKDELVSFIKENIKVDVNE